MKKGLLLSVVASTMIFAGGDIAPVEPAAAAPVADCSDFYGSIGAYYQTAADDAGDLFATSGPYTGVSASTNFSVTATFGIERTLYNGIGFGAEVSGWTSLGWPDVTNNVTPRVPAGTPNDEAGQLSQLYLTMAFDNTAIKAGRFELPMSLSPFAWTDSWAGAKDVTFEGVLVANTDLADTTLYGAAITKTFAFNTRSKIGSTGDTSLFAMGLVNKSLANTTIKAVGYYSPEYELATATTTGDVYAGFASVDTAVADVKLSAQTGFVGGDTVAFPNATFMFGAKLAGTLGMFDYSVAGSYVNDGDYPLSIVGGPWWMYTANEETGTLVGGTATTALLAKISTKVGIGKLYGSYGYWDADTSIVANGATAIDYSTGIRVGYKFKVAGVNMKAEYRYRSRTDLSGTETKRNRVRLEAQYKF